MEKKNEEIDFLELLLKGLNTIKANFWLIITFLVLGAAIGFAKFFTERKVFENRMLVSSGILTEAYTEISIERIKKNLGENNKSVLARDLQLSPEDVANIRDVRIEELIEPKVPKEPDRFIIIAETYSQEILPDLQRGLIGYFENNDFVKVRVEQDKKFLKQMIAKMEDEIKDLEAWKVKITSGSFFQSVQGNVAFDPTTVNSKIVEMTKEKLTMENNLALASSVQVIEGFTPFQNPTRPKLAVYIMGGAAIGLTIVMILIVLKSIRKVMSKGDYVQQTP